MGGISKNRILVCLALFAVFLCGLLARPGDAYAQPKTITLTATATELRAQLTGPGRHDEKDVVFMAGTTRLGTVPTNSTGLATLSLSGLTPGVYSVFAVQPGSEYSNSNSVSVTVMAAPRTLNFSPAPPSSMTFGDAAVILSAVPSAGVGQGTITYTLVSGAESCILSGATLTPKAFGDCVVRADITASGAFSAASTSLVTIHVNRADRTITAVATPATITFGATSTLSANVSAGEGAVSYATASPCSISGTTLSADAAGVCSVTATIAQTATHNSATSPPINVTINEASRTLNFSPSPPGPMTFGGGAITLSATPSEGGGEVAYTLVSGPCTLEGATLTSTGAGSCIVSASIPAFGGYAAASTGEVTLVVGKASQAALEVTASPSPIAVNSTSVISATGGSGTGAVTYFVTAGACTITDNVLTANAAGSCTVTATKAGDDNYTAITSSAITIIVNPLPQTISVLASPNAIKVGGNAALTMQGVQGSGAQSFHVTGPCTISGSTLTGTGVGACSIIGKVAADANYLAAESGAITVNVSQATTSVALSANSTSVQFGASVTFTAIVTGASPTGSVTFRKDGVNLATVPLSNGQASFTTSTLGTGANTLIAIYGGDASNIAATSNPLTVNVLRANPALDPDVRGIAVAQVGALRRFAETQIENVHRRLETLHRDELQCVGAEVCVTYNHGIGLTQGQPREPVRALGYAADPRLEARDSAFQAVDLNARSEPGAIARYLHGGPTIAIWSAGAINIGKYENNGALIDNRFNTSGVTAGADMLIAPGFKAGIAMGYGRDRTDVGSWGSKSTAGGLAATVYGSYRVYGPLFLDALAGIGDASLKSRRVLPGEVEDATGRRNGLYWYGSAALTFEQRWERLSLAPYLRFDVIRGSLDPYVESGPQNFALAYESASIRSSSGILGLRGGYDIPMEWGVLAPMARLEYRRVIENDVGQALSYANEAGIVYPMFVNGLSRNVFQAGLGLRASRDALAGAGGVSGEIEYLFGAAGSEYRSHALRGAVKIAW